MDNIEVRLKHIIVSYYDKIDLNQINDDTRLLMILCLILMI